MAQAPVLIVLCTVFVEASKEGRDSQIQHFPEYASDMDCIDQELFQALNQEEHQTQIAGTRMVMAAREQGLETCWVSQFDVLALAMLLDLPMNMLPSEILAFGYPALFQWPFPKNIFGKIPLTKV